MATLEIPVHRLRHPLRVRHLRPGDPRRLAGGNDGQMAAPGQSLGTPAPAVDLRGQIRRPYRTQHGKRRIPGALDSPPCGARHGLRHAGAGLPRQHRQLPPPVAGGRRRVLRLPRLQHRRLLRRGDGEDRLGEHHQGPVSERRAAPGQAVAPAAAVLLRLLRAAGHDPGASADGAAAWRISTASSPSSSTTPIRPSPSPS